MPLTELTHLNYAFAFVDPQSYGLVVMDSDTTEDLWQLTVDTKRYNPNLKVFVAVGGWTFSDNGTATQPLLGEIASTEANRQRFADAVVRFLNTYGFDGLDLDWEYPGAPDRGGKPEDTENYTLLMKTLRSTFDGSPRPLGLTFTIPSSYWYLRWFDLPGLLKYADWTNLMSYDLHGTWDRNNPIGAIAQSHTNLTEIKLATQLLWRVGIQPSQVALGYGFYGRSFELADPACSTPGCAFTGGARPGPCSDTSGVLMYYEIQAILEQVPDLKPVFDKEAVAKYLVFDKNQWVSYDDAETFKLKLAWADEIGIGGSMIWAVDTDDSKFSAMSGLVGYPVSHVNTKVDGVNSLSMNKANVGSVLQGENGQGCKALLDASCRPKRDLRCGSGEMLIGWDRDGCVCCSSRSSSSLVSHIANPPVLYRAPMKESPSAARPRRLWASAPGEEPATMAASGATATANATRASLASSGPDGAAVRRRIASRTRIGVPEAIRSCVARPTTTSLPSTDATGQIGTSFLQPLCRLRRLMRKLTIFLSLFKVITIISAKVTRKR